MKSWCDETGAVFLLTEDLTLYTLNMYNPVQILSNSSKWMTTLCCTDRGRYLHPELLIISVVGEVFCLDRHCFILKCHWNEYNPGLALSQDWKTCSVLWGRPVCPTGTNSQPTRPTAFSPKPNFQTQIVDVLLFFLHFRWVGKCPTHGGAGRQGFNIYKARQMSTANQRLLAWSQNNSSFFLFALTDMNCRGVSSRFRLAS